MSLAKGIAAFQAGDLPAAERFLLAAVQADQAAHQAWQLLSMVAVRAGSADAAVERAKRAVALDRKNPGYFNTLGIACSEHGDLAGAEQAFRRAVKLKPAFAEAHYNLAKVLRDRDRLDGALQEYRRAHALEPGAVATQLGLAAMYRVIGQPAQALQVLRDAVRNGPLDSDHVPYLAECIADVEGADAAVDWLQRLLKEQPGFQQAHHILGLLLLSVGRWLEGWPHFLWRTHWDRERATLRPPALAGRLDGRRVFLRAEEGIGDILFYLRFAPQLVARGAELALECPAHMAKLAPLIAGKVQTGTQQPSDLPVWIADLPALLHADAAQPPFALEKPKAKDMLARLGHGPYLGLTWRGGTDAKRARAMGADQAGLRLVFKDLAPGSLAAAVRGWPGTLVSLQRGLRPGELDELSRAAGAKVHDLAGSTDDLEEALGVLGALDEYVGVINTNMHLLAGIGGTARVLVPRPIDWRWMRDGDSPWFPGFSLYRQPPSYDWTEPLSRLREDLLARAGSSPRARA
jgi:tetratricopeptide (TPR) repeat protein